METLNCGFLSINGSQLQVVAKVNEQGELCGWTVINKTGSYVDVDLWNTPTDDGNVIEVAVKKACEVFDDVVLLSKDINLKGTVDFKLYLELKRAGVDVDKVCRKLPNLQGKRNYKISIKSPDVLNSTPPDRDDYQDHASYRTAMNEYMRDTTFQRKVVSNGSHYVATVVESEDEYDISSYNSQLAIYQCVGCD